MNGTRTEHIDTVIIGAGQAGLAAGYYLAQRDRQFVILDSIGRIGDNWRCHYDSLRLYSPAKTASLPGMRFPAAPMDYPTKDQMADFLEAYATRFELPVRCGTRVQGIRRDNGGYQVHTDGRTLTCRNVVVASGTFGRRARVPEFAKDLDPGIVAMHSSEYKSPDQLKPGAVLVVGASHSGSDVAYEAASAGHPTILSGPIRGEIPFDLNGRPARVAFPVLSFLANHVLTLRTPIGRKMKPQFRSHGGPLLRYKRADLTKVGVELVSERTVGVTNGLPTLDGGRVLDVTNVIWCTGFRQDFSWIDPPVTGDDGWPLETRGVVPSSPGLYFVGLAFQYAFSSMLVVGAGRDAEYVVKHLVSGSRSGVSVSSDQVRAGTTPR